ncbi:hypothetical protein ACIBAH_33900 [Streptomyces sp. NPDC051445]|uniref:hypothetical protein n=1 Tax=Streptomyces sp. NPDC051445 TaxID=3365653 RepID=UPI0037AC94A1
MPVELWSTESIISEFLKLFEAAQEEIGRRWNGQGRSDFLQPVRDAGENHK